MSDSIWLIFQSHVCKDAWHMANLLFKQGNCCGGQPAFCFGADLLLQHIAAEFPPSCWPNLQRLKAPCLSLLLADAFQPTGSKF